MPDIMKEVPEVLRDPVSDPMILTSLLPNYLQDHDITTAVRYIEGAMDHQRYIREEDSRWFAIPELEEIEIIERELDSGFVLGKKARLHFRDKGFKTDKITEQHIDTGWIEFNGFNKETMAFEVALANTLLAIAEENVGKKVFVYKAIYFTPDGDKLRYAANLRPSYDNDQDDEDDRSSRRKNKGKSKPRRRDEEEDDDYEDDEEDGEDYSEEIHAEINKIDKDEFLNDDDVEFLEWLFADGKEVDDEEIEEQIAEYLGIDTDDVVTPKRLRDRNEISRAIKFLLETLKEIEDEDDDE